MILSLSVLYGSIASGRDSEIFSRCTHYSRNKIDSIDDICLVSYSALSRVLYYIMYGAVLGNLLVLEYEFKSTGEQGLPLPPICKLFEDLK